MRRRTVLTTLLAAALLLASAAPARAQGKVYIEINPSDQRRLPIAVVNFVNASTGQARQDPAVGKLLADVIGRDLDFTGQFRVLDPAGFVEDTAKRAVLLREIDFSDWTTAGAEAVVKGRYRVEGQTLRVEAYLYDPLQQKQLAGREYTAEVSAARRIAHRFASDVLEALSGEAGAFDTRIAFVSNRSGTKELYVMDYDGQNLRRVTRTDSINLVPAWSPDGKRLAFVSFMERNPDLFILDLTMKEEEKKDPLLRVKLPFAWRGSFNGGAWSVRGDLFAFGVSREGNSDIWVMNWPSGSGLRQLTNHFAQDVAPAFSPDGRQVVFVSDRGGNPTLYVADVRGGEARRLVYEGKNNVSPAWSPKGDRIAFACQDDRGRFDICAVNPDGTALARLTGEGSSDSPSWSPDGRFIAFESSRDGAKRIYVMNANGGSPRRVVPAGLPGQGEDTAPTWSPRPVE